MLWQTVYPWPQRPNGLVELGFKELGALWKPILDIFKEDGVDLCYELHPGEDLHDGVTFERFLEEVNHHLLRIYCTILVTSICSKWTMSVL